MSLRLTLEHLFWVQGVQLIEHRLIVSMWNAHLFHTPVSFMFQMLVHKRYNFDSSPQNNKFPLCYKLEYYYVYTSNRLSVDIGF